MVAVRSAGRVAGRAALTALAAFAAAAITAVMLYGAAYTIALAARL